MKYRRRDRLQRYNERVIVAKKCAKNTTKNKRSIKKKNITECSSSIIPFSMKNFMHVCGGKSSSNTFIYIRGTKICS